MWLSVYYEVKHLLNEKHLNKKSYLGKETILVECLLVTGKAEAYTAFHHDCLKEQKVNNWP